MSPFLSRIIVISALGLAVLPAPSSAQGFGNPFAGRPAGAGPGPYGNDAGASIHLMQMGPAAKPGVVAAAAARGPRSATESEPTHQAEPSKAAAVLEAMFVGCAAGTFLGGFTAWATVVPAAELAAAAAPPAAPGLLAAGAIGCGLGAATAVVSLGASSLWAWVIG